VGEVIRARCFEKAFGPRSARALVEFEGGGHKYWFKISERPNASRRFYADVGSWQVQALVISKQ
jgi:hypothetical protein